MENEGASKLRDALDGGEVREVLEDTFYRSAERPSRQRGKRRGRGRAKTGAKAKPKPKPDHYEVICISLYKEDLERLDDKVARLKESGHRKMSRSALIRFALDHAPLDRLPKAY